MHQIAMENKQEKLLVSLPEAVDFIAKAVSSDAVGGEKNRVLIHSLVISRGAILTMAYMMKVKGFKRDDAVEMLKDRELFSSLRYVRAKS